MTSAAIPVPSFVTVDADALTAQLVARYQADTGRTLQPAQVERLLIDLLAYEGVLAREAVQETGEQSLVAFARYPMLDYLGENVGVTRLQPSAATTMLQITLAATSGTDTLIAAGALVQSADNLATFATSIDLTIPAGQLVGLVPAAATVAGEIGNGYLAGQIATIVAPIAGVATIANTTTSASGAELEDDDALRARIPLAPSRFSNAGSSGAYKYLAVSAHPAIVDAAVSSPAPGQVKVSVLTNTGAPSSDVLAAVTAALNAETVRPLTDTVIVSAPASVDFAITGTITPYRSADADALATSVAAAAATFAAALRASLGRDIVPAQLVAALMLAGVYSIDLTSPAAVLPVDVDAWANATSITFTVLPGTDS